MMWHDLSWNGFRRCVGFLKSALLPIYSQLQPLDTRDAPIPNSTRRQLCRSADLNRRLPNFSFFTEDNPAATRPIPHPSSRTSAVDLPSVSQCTPPTRIGPCQFILFSIDRHSGKAMRRSRLQHVEKDQQRQYSVTKETTLNW